MANVNATPAPSAARSTCPSSQPHASSTSITDVSNDVSIIKQVPVNVVTDNEEEEEVTMAEFSVDLTDGQTWAINFYECAAEGDLECLEEILDSGRVGANDVDVDGFTALMVAAAEGHRDVVRALLRRGANVTARTHDLRSTALHFAAKNGDAEIVAALCECDAKAVDCWNINADTPLIWACIEGRVEAVKVLLEHGADVNVLNQYGTSTLLCAVMIGEDSEQDKESDKGRAAILTMLLEKNKKLVNFQDREGSSAMHLAASCGYLQCVKTLLAFGADITLRNVIGQTPLEEAQDSELENGPCVEHLRGIWRQLEEEAAARMMAMLEMEEEADKSATGTASGLSVATSNKKNKKKNKKAKRKAAAKQQQLLEQDLTDSIDNLTEQSESQYSKDVCAAESGSVSGEPSADPNRSAVAANANAVEGKDDKASSVSSDENEDVPSRASVVSVFSQNSDGDRDEEGQSIDTDMQSARGMEVDVASSAGAWTTVGKKQRSAIAAITNTLTKAPASPSNERVPLSSVPRRESTCSFFKTVPLESRRKFNQRSNSVGERSLAREHLGLASRPSSTRQVDIVADTPTRSREKRFEKTSGFAAESRSIALSSQLNPNALAFGSLGLTTGPSKLSSLSTASAINSTRLPMSFASPWRSSFGSSSAPYTIASSSSSASLHHSVAGRLTWKQQRASGNQQGARETRDGWVSKLRLSNESVAETLNYLACGLCGELVNDNLQCSGGVSRNSEKKVSSACTQLYCVSCLESSAYQAAHSTIFKCVRCHEMIPKESMSRNSLAQAQAASLGLSMPNSSSAGIPDDTNRYTLETMQHTLEMSAPRVSAVALRAFHLVPGTDLSMLSNGQLEVLESVHQLALAEIVEQRLANARVLERLQMEEWLKMQQNVLQFAPR